ncbi:MAG: pyrroline-5-carboxylate reductase [Myxococcota bacterium]|nr:pyrroline-5-carboxylate reductase [Myxococcota bacterium]
MSSALSDRRIGFIGSGAMARALAGGLLSSGVSMDRIQAADPAAASREEFEREVGAAAVSDNGALVAECDVIVIAVKPGIVSAVLDDLSGQPDLDRPLWISIAAGIPLASLQDGLPGSARIVRAMPNTPALVGAGATAYCANAAAREEDREIALALFESVGTVWQAPDESMLDAVTGLSGSGPAYILLVLEALIDAGVQMGLPADAAHQLACQTVLGASRLALESGRAPAELREQVTSPGGTTVAGLPQLVAAEVRAAFADAVAAATARSRELSGS